MYDKRDMHGIICSGGGGGGGDDDDDGNVMATMMHTSRI
jgi:hypothetical protein